ncbi:hypothetical protein R6Z07M_009421 [Ovis aries]
MPVCACSVTKLYLTLCNPWTVARQAPLSMGFFRQESWSYHFLLQRVFPGIEPPSPALATRFFTTQPPGKHRMMLTRCKGYGCGKWKLREKERMIPGIGRGWKGAWIKAFFWGMQRAAVLGRLCPAPGHQTPLTPSFDPSPCLQQKET